MKYLLRLELEWEVEAPTPDDALEELAERIYENNETPETLFWESIEVIESKGD